ncbi:MAG TPA: radical SAM protein [Candidatus Polarisedimenticolia bacterium]|nr:radical SAM protein [Candidatus Polarisedimenticolia bacterium]
MKKLRVGILELISDSVWQNPGSRFYGTRFRRHYASIMPQTVAVWCRQLGHDVTYATYYGQQDPGTLLPAQLDVLFISTYTHASATGYALARLHRRRGALTVIGGPHARSFPADCLRFFDLAVHDCDKELIEGILSGGYDRGQILSSGRALTEIPTVEERLPYIIKSSVTEGRPPYAANIGLLSSVGCPYTCDFCVDWSSRYVSIAGERLRADLQFIARRFPGVYVSYHDPNFGIRFDETMDIIASLPVEQRNPYVMESSLSILKGPRLKRLKETNCFYTAPGIESWSDYSNKTGVGRNGGREKLEGVLQRLAEIHEFVPNIQANFIFGTDVDEGNEPVEMTKEFIRRAPYVWPTINIPTPYGRTPLYDDYLAKGRILTSMPFSFYYMPYLVMTLKNYTPMEYYEGLIDIYSAANSLGLLKARVDSTPDYSLKVLYFLRAFAFQGILAKLRRTLRRLREDPEFLGFHEGRSTRLPAYYRRLYVKRMGRYAELISAADMTPDLEASAATPARSVPRILSPGAPAITPPPVAAARPPYPPAP